MKNLHYGHCLIGIALAAVMLVALGVSTSTLGLLAVVLACPLMMFLMMRAMSNNPPIKSTRDDDQPADDSRLR